MLKTKPFTSYRLDDEKAEDKSKVIPVRMNLKEMAMLKDVMTDLNTDNPSTALKKGFFVGHNVIHQQFGEQFWKGLMRKDK